MATQRERLEALPAFLQPRLRLFLSADLVGSTASKQRPYFPIQKPSELWADGGMAPPWLSPIAKFFGNFREAFIREWRLFKSQTVPLLNIGVETDPSFWKANGDELIFVKELDDRREILGCVLAWLRAIESVRPQLIESKLDIKATAWTAGFPVTNSELIFRTDTGSQEEYYEGDSRLQQFALVQKWRQGPDARGSLTMDFIGPSVDIGFRLASQSSSRRFIISIDIAYFLSNMLLPPKCTIKVPPIYYGGKVELKGVLGGKPYPIFWIDTKTSAQHDTAVPPEDRLLSDAKASHISEFCIEFYQDNATLMFEPFIFREDPGQYGEFPENYIEALEYLNATWQSEKTRYARETEVDIIAEDDNNSLSEIAALQMEKEIISAIEEQSSKK